MQQDRNGSWPRRFGYGAGGLPTSGRQWLRVVLGIIAAIVSAYYGKDHFPNGGATTSADPYPSQVSGYGKPIDGDSLYVGGNEVRLKGIDAPEGRQTCQRENREWACGNAARDELAAIIGRDTVTCDVFERDKHGRLLAACSAGGRSLNAGMVSSGMAVSYGGYVREEGDAKMRKRGLWGSEFERPRDWRHERGIGM